MSKIYKYHNAMIMKITDGDTATMLIDLGFNTWKKITVRFYGINAPETRTSDKEEKERGLASKQYVSDMLPVGSYVSVDILGQEKYGRWLAILYKEDMNINEHLIANGYAKENYYGNKKV